MSEDRPLRVRSASPRVRLLGNHSRRAKSPSVDPTVEAYRRDVERTIRRDPTSLPVPSVTPRGRSPERATTTETQRHSTDNDVYQEQYNILCERLRAPEPTLLDTTCLLRQAEHRLKTADYMIQYGAEGYTQSEDEAFAREYPAHLFRNLMDAMKLREYLELEAFNERLHLAVLQYDHLKHVQQSRDRANSLEIHCKLLQNSLTDAKSVETLRYEIALLRATADHAESDFNLGDQHQEKLLAIRQKTLNDYFRYEISTEALLRGMCFEFDERARYRRARDDSRRQWDAQLQALYKNHMECYRQLSLGDARVANAASGNTSRENRVGERGEMPHVSLEGPGNPKPVRGRQAVPSGGAAYRPQSHQQSHEAQTTAMPSHPHQTNRGRRQQRKMQQATRKAAQAANRIDNAMRNEKNGSQVSMQGEHTHRGHKQTRAINNTNGRLGKPDESTRHREAQLRTPLSAPPTQVSPPRKMGFERNHKTNEHGTDSSQPMSPYDISSATIEQAQREGEDSQHNGGAGSELGAEGSATESSNSTTDSTVAMGSSVVSKTALDLAGSNDSAQRSTAGMRGGEDNNPSNERARSAGSSHTSYGSDSTLVSRSSKSYPKFPQHSPNKTSASGSTPTPQPSAPGNLGAPRRPTRPSLSPFQGPRGSTNPSTSTGLGFSGSEFEQAIRSNITRNMNLNRRAPAFASPPIQSQVPCDPSLLHDPTPYIPRQPAPVTPITANTYPDPTWNTANSRIWIYQNLVTHCGFTQLGAHHVVMRWMGGGMALRHMSLFDWQTLTCSHHAGLHIFRRLN
ncbi:uncharacterized protein EAF01_003375 [Botrytis porri]|uniref:uncharacterized protein n=1 Tax=Botrytis porri TaxID=87229 RepID=UPI001901A357|nr:uncharacterized protein EAF01_003375 [Botrytis porri]KAF7909657.1 hypothetical protein EAF01_003375 [Botrytis porri]